MASPYLWNLRTQLGVIGSNFEMKPEPRHPPAFGLHFEVRAGHASHNGGWQNPTAFRAPHPLIPPEYTPIRSHHPL